MKTVKYRTSYSIGINAFEIVKETAAQIVYKKDDREIREAKRSEWANWHDSFEDAKQFLIDKQKSKIEAAKRQIEAAELDIAEIETLVNN